MSVPIIILLLFYYYFSFNSIVPQNAQMLVAGVDNATAIHPKTILFFTITPPLNYLHRYAAIRLINRNIMFILPKWLISAVLRIFFTIV